MTELKTKATTADVGAFIASISDAGQRSACEKILELMQAASGEDPKMWGASMIGFGSYNYAYDSGRNGTWFLMGFSPRKNNITLYFMAGIERYKTELQQLGKHTTGKSCLYIKSLDDVKIPVLKKIMQLNLEDIKTIALQQKAARKQAKKK